MFKTISPLQPVDSKRSLIIMLVIFAVLALVPWLHTLPATSALHLSDYGVTLLGRLLCYGLAAMALNLIWGYAGILSLGHGLYFALGGYVMGMYLMREANPDALPPFMTFLDWKTLPWFWQGSDHFAWMLLMLMLVPGLIAGIFGYFAFRSKIKGVYFSIITQAMTYAAMLLFFRNETGFGGNNGFTGFTTLLGHNLSAPTTRALLCCLSALALAATYLGLRWLLSRPYGRVLGAVRDSENRLQYLGYRTLYYKWSAWVLSALIAAVAGALYVPQVGIINPSEMSPTNSIEMAVWVAVGGRGTLVGPLLGAGLVNGLKSYFTVALPDAWLLILGGLFIGVTLFLPYGIMGLFQRFRQAKGNTPPAPTNQSIAPPTDGLSEKSS